MICCTQHSTVFPLPPWVRPGVRVVCIDPFTAGFETVTEVCFEAKIELGARGVISFVDNDVIKVTGADKTYPSLQVQLLRQDFQSYWRKMLPHEYG